MVLQSCIGDLLEYVMNERIKELVEQCWIDDECGYGCGRTQEFDPNKFAELIVQECINVLYDNELWSRDVSHVLNEHFGDE